MAGKTTVLGEVARKFVSRRQRVLYLVFNDKAKVFPDSQVPPNKTRSEVKREHTVLMADEPVLKFDVQTCITPIRRTSVKQMRFCIQEL